MKPSATLLSIMLTTASYGQPKDPEPAANTGNLTVKDFLGDERVIFDGDGDGWDDLWSAMYPEFKDRSKTADADGDGVSNYDEMILWRDPLVKGPLPSKPTAEETAENARLAKIAQVEAKARKEREWPARKAALALTLRPLFEGKEADPDNIRNDSAAQKQAALQRLAEAKARSAENKTTLERIAAKYGIEREGTDKNQKGWTLVGDSPAGPILMTTQDARSSDSINADDLWPIGLYPWQMPALTRNLTGAGVTTAIFEAGVAPGILTTHQEFDGRATQVGVATAGNHATAVADAIAGGGVVDVTRGGPTLGRLLRGVAYQSLIRGNPLDNFQVNSTTSAVGGQRFSNHSYGASGGWETVTLGGVTYWFWPFNDFAEDPRLGMYSSASLAGISSVDLDSFVRTNLTQLPVFASGNPNNYGPNIPLTSYVTAIGGFYTVSSTIRDWFNGDDGGYDTVISPATAKNVLSVGSIIDLNGAAAIISTFSGTGPTDDGRIKPDLVAVGQRNTALGLGSSLFLANAGGIASYYNGITPDSEGNTSYQGTSFAAPQVTGALALAQQRRTQLYPLAGPLRASTWRALAINSAAEIGAPGPDFKYGWGRYDAVAVNEGLEADARIGRGSMIKEFDVIQGQPIEFLVTLAAATPAIFTLAWDDPAGTPAPSNTVVDSPTKMLVNDLDITVIEQDSAITRYPWILNPDLAGRSAALRGAPAVNTVIAGVIPRDDRNNVERVNIVATAQVRTLRVRVAPMGNLQGGVQRVSLVLSGARPAPPTNISLISTQNPNNADEMALTLATDSGGFFTVTSSIDLITWADIPNSSFQATGVLSTVLVNKNPQQEKLFWRLRSGQ